MHAPFPDAPLGVSAPQQPEDAVAPIPVRIDISVLGTGALYRRHRTGVYRWLKDFIDAIAPRPDISLDYACSGRAPWTELPAAHAAAEQGWNARFASRDGRFPGARLVAAAATRAIFAGLRARLLSEAAAAGCLQAAGLLISREPTAPLSGIWVSPAHALPALPRHISRCLVVHDMIPVLHPEWFPGSAPFHAAIRSVDPARDWVLCVSESTRRDWLAWSGMPEERVEVILSGLSGGFLGDQTASEPLPSGVEGSPFLLAVGTLEPRKNLSALIRAFAILAADPRVPDDLRLVLVGPLGWKNEEFQRTLEEHPGIRRRIVLPGFVSDAQLRSLYAACTAFVFPSLYEGFGLPLLEAMSAGAGVVCARNSSLPEVVGEAGILVDRAEPNCLAEGIRTLLGDRRIRERMGALAMERARTFTWSRFADSFAAFATRIQAQRPPR